MEVIPWHRASTPNTALRDLLAEAQWTRGQLARAITRVAAEAGLTLTYDASAASHWLRGTLPRPEARPLICEALSRRLGRPITTAQAGFGSEETSDTDVVSGLVDLGRADMDPSRSGVLATGLYSAALMVPLYTELSGRLEASKAGRTVRVGAGEVATVRTMTERIADILDELGGGHARPMAAAFLVNTVSPYLRADASTKVKKGLLAAASDLVYLTGWMAMYEREHGLVIYSS